MSLLAEESCPVSDGLFARLYRSSPEGLAALIRTVEGDTRARLAVYCSRRVHLQELGLAIAQTCSEYDLQRFGGGMGVELLDRAQATRAATRTDDTPRHKSSKGVTLASGKLWNPCPLQD